ncbi:netrin-1-like [Coregonus clupeaformis]|uniref:netrin-1-like n=1 Tax=Coregonus clupeaformis TaxID=59861 RepID=UPI001BE08777|nr:netrin-1-like [Coregonus clupeaformis]XP_041723894.1 netrin-1-like [Coregonus clupeaformis]
MMFLPFSSLPSLSLPFILLLLPFLPPSLLSPSLSHSPLSWTSPHDPCYHLDGRPRHCLSEFINAAYGVPVSAAHSFRGTPGQNAVNVSSLTDLHNPHNLTCWTAQAGGPDGGDWVLTLHLGRRFEVTYISLQFCQQGEPSDPISLSVLKSMDHGRTWRPMQHYSSDCPGRFGLQAQTVAQTRHQETEPLCSDPRPLQRHRGGMLLAFSTLDGRPSSPDFDYSPTLQDWVTATDIRVVFHQVTQSQQSKVGSSEGERGEAGQGEGAGGGFLRWRAGSKNEAVVGHGDKVNGDNNKWGFAEKERKKIEKRRRSGGGHNKGSGDQGEDGHNVTRKESEGDSPEMDTSKRGNGKGKGRGLEREGGHHWSPCQEGSVCGWTIESKQGRINKGRELRRRRNNHRNSEVRANRKLELAPPSPLISAPLVLSPLALSDLQVGGRCKCNGHASRCRRDDAGRAVCVCEHHTAGADCDVCEDFYYDRPWQRATPSQPQPCVLCECNSHSSKCRFSMEVFQQSGRHSGGVCLKCRHHTAGRHCQYCQNGYTRDHSKPPTHRKACQPCQCHPMGAVGLWCNQTSGQCLCRDGVTGLRCNRCAPGYKQGHSPLRPCIRIQEVAPTTPVYQPQYSIAEECVSYCLPSQVKVRMNLETYCLKDYVLKLQVRGMERSGPWWQFSVWIQTVFRTGSYSSVRRGPQALWVPNRDLGCGCPALQVGRTFLLIGSEEGGRGPEERRLVADRSTLALQWREHWNPKLRGFRGQDKRGRCPPKLPGGGDPHRGHLKHHHSEYTPPHLVTEKETEVEVHPEHTNPHTHPHTPSDSMKDMEEEAEHSVALDTHTHIQSSSHHRPETPQEQQQEQTPSPSTPSLICSTPV